MDKRFKQVLLSFQKDFQTKVSQKCPGNMGEKEFINKTFRFFDIQNKGAVSCDQFKRAIAKIGVVVAEENDLDLLFQYYDKSRDGNLDYKEFSAIFHSGQSSQSNVPLRPANLRNEQQEYPGATSQQKKKEIAAIVALFRDKIKGRGARGIVGIKRIFHIMDDDQSGALSVGEFEKACRDYKIAIAPEFMPTLFDAFDQNKDGSLSIGEFIYAICGDLPPQRRAIVQQAFQANDRQEKGFLTMREMRKYFYAGRHPDVKQNLRTEEQVLQEFLETYELHHSSYKQRRPDGNISPQEFLSYYQSISWLTDDDDYFDLIIRSVWGMTPTENPYKKFEKGYYPEPKPDSRQRVDPLFEPTPVYRSGVNSQDFPFNQTAKYHQAVTTATRANNTGPNMYDGPPSQSKLATDYRRSFQAQQQAPAQYPPSVVVTGPKQFPKYQQILIERCRAKLKERGQMSLIGLGRTMRMMDSNGDGHLDMDELAQACKDYGLDLHPKDVKSLFTSLDFDQSGGISYHEFMSVMAGPMSDFRRDLVLNAFKQLDKTQAGSLTLDTIKSSFQPEGHPDVKSGKLTPEEIEQEFMQTFDTHHAMEHGSGAGQQARVSPDQFLAYFAAVSMNIEQDSYFELLMGNIFDVTAAQKQAYAGSRQKLTQVNARDAYRNDHHRNLFGTDSGTPFDKRSNTNWETTQKQSFRQTDVNQAVPMAGGGKQAQSGYEDPRLSFVRNSNKITPAQYKGIRHTEDEIIEMFRQRLLQRGQRGIIGMMRVFKAIDTDGNGTLDIQEFWKGLCDYCLPISPEECRQVFDKFDLNQDGDLSYEELLYSICLPLTPYRKDIVARVFKKLDRDESGQIPIRDIEQMYEAKAHPDVKSGKRSEQEVLAEFLDTFNLHLQLELNVPTLSKNQKVDNKMFTEYYRNVGSSIESDELFELIMTNVWNLNSKTYSKGWGTHF